MNKQERIFVLTKYENGGRDFIDEVTAYKSIGLIHEMNDLSYHDKPITKRMLYVRLAENNNFLYGDGWKIEEVNLFRIKHDKQQKKTAFGQAHS